MQPTSETDTRGRVSLQFGASQKYVPKLVSRHCSMRQLMRPLGYECSDPHRTSRRLRPRQHWAPDPWRASTTQSRLLVWIESSMTSCPAPARIVPDSLLLSTMSVGYGVVFTGLGQVSVDKRSPAPGCIGAFRSG